VIICDGHKRRLQLTFSEYIGAASTRWDPLLGVPYATSYWQVGDSSEQNGMFKMRWIMEKAKLILFKAQHNLPLTLNASDIIPLAVKAWYASFAKPNLVTKAVADRGWNPLNYALLKHPEILATKRALARNKEIATTETNGTVPNSLNATVKQKDGDNFVIEINLGKGTAKQCMSMLVEMALRNGGIESRGEELETGEQIMGDLSKLTKWTSGHLIKQGFHCLSTIEILHAAREQAQQKKSKEDEQNKNHQERQRAFAERMKSVAKLIKDKPDLNFDTWNATECKGYLQYYKNDADPKLPSRVADLRARCCVVRDEKRPQPALPSTVAEDESDDDLSFGFL